MKGLTHFISAIATASFFPQVVRMSATPGAQIDGAQSSFILALAGLYGIMPDTLDFKFGRFFETAEIDVYPDPRNPDAQAIADTLGSAMDRAIIENREIRIQFHTVQLSADHWRQYQIAFDAERQEVAVVIGPVVTTSQVAFAGTEPDNRVGIYRLKHARLKPGGARSTTVDIMSGPMYGFRPGQDHVLVDFLPWHRTWSHSYVVGAALALPLWPLALWMNWPSAWLYPLIAFLGFSTHVTEDLTGHMGGSLFWPFFRERTRGLCWFHAANPDSNFVTDYIAVTLILFNLDRFVTKLIPLSAPVFFLLFLIGPLLLYFLPRLVSTKPAPKARRQDSVQGVIEAHRRQAAQEELLDESESIVG